MSIEAMKQALEALERYSGVDQRACDAEDALRTAIEQAEKQEPVAWEVVSDGKTHKIFRNHKEAADYSGGLNARYPDLAKNARVRPLIYGDTTPPAAPVQELAEYDAGLLNDYGGGNVEWWQDYIRYELGCAYEHYKEQLTTPPAAQRQWVGLTDWERGDCVDKGVARGDGWASILKEVEAKLREKNGGQV